MNSKKFVNLMRIACILPIIISLLYCSCSKNDGKEAIVDTGVTISYKNSTGADLLAPTTQNYFNPINFHIYDVVNGNKKEVYYPNFDYPQNFYIYKNDSTHLYYLKVFVETDTTLLELSKNITDTIISVIDKSNGNSIVRKVWYDGLLKWDNFNIPRQFTIIK